jgi:drug/metabolite transporter (DMT)-like permease
MRRDRIDAAGAAGLIGIAALLAFNQIVIVWVNQGLQPVFFAGLRSALAVGFVWAWLWARGRPPVHTPGTALPGLLAGAVFAAEFLCLFLALDLTMVGRAVLIFYSMPVWLAILCHFGLPGDRLTPLRVLGLALALAGTGIAIFDRSGATAGQASLAGDLLALGAAFGWAGTAFVARATRLREVGAEVQLLWMVAVSAPVLLLAAPLFGPLLRDLQPSHIGWLVFQSSVVVAGGFIGWLALLARYPAASVASFAFLTPVISLALGWLLLDEPVGPGLLVALALVASGIALINRRPAAPRPDPAAEAPQNG